MTKVSFVPLLDASYIILQDPRPANSIHLLFLIYALTLLYLQIYFNPGGLYGGRPANCQVESRLFRVFEGLSSLA
jgi:hypothetical protein